MKKFYAFMAAALMSASMYAAAPTVADLAAEYDVVNNVVFCIEFIEDANVCRDVRFVGTPNNWGKGDTEAEGWDNCEKFAPVDGFDGWYAAELPYSAGFQGKPLHEPEDRSWTWDFQCGDKDAWVHVDGEELTITDGYADECNIAASKAGVYIYQLKYWKQHKNPCVAQVPHDYTITLYAPEGCGDKPGIIGDFCNWETNGPKAMNEDVDDEFNTIYKYSFNDVEGHGFKIVSMPAEGEKVDWSNQMYHYDTENDNWYEGANEILADVENIVLQWNDGNHRFGLCDGEATREITINLLAPAGAPEVGVEVLGDWNSWAGDEMTLSAGKWTVTVANAKSGNGFKFRQKGSWDNQIMVLNASNEWEACGNLKLADYMESADANVAEVDLSDAEQYRWTWGEGIENVVLTEKAQKVVVDGVLYIVRDNKMYNAQGTQVR